MELVKREDHWALYNEDGHKIAATLSGCYSKLSVKNCQAIELGYDLDELADEHCNKLYHEGNINWDHYRVHFKEGFKKALSILSDKKFSEQQVRRAISAGLSIGYGRQFEIENKQIEVESYMKSLQQTEWDVIVEMEQLATFTSMPKEGEKRLSEKPKLDSNGNLILKRI